MTFYNFLLTTSRFPTRLVASLLLLFLATTLSGCQPFIEVMPDTPAAPLAAATVIPASHALAIIGVDFDPPLDSRAIASGDGVTLLVALENQGQSTETGVQVTARLMDGVVDGKPVELLNETLTIRTLAPGELFMARFSQVTDLPVRSRYALLIEVDAVPGELDTRDNSRSYDIVVHGTD